MKSSSIQILKELKDLLLQVPTIVDQFEKKRSGSVDTLCVWLSNAEKILIKYNFHNCSELAGLRANVLHVKLDPSSKPRERKRLGFAKGLSVIMPAQNVIIELITPIDERVKSARSLIKQILQVAKTQGILPDFNESTFTHQIYAVWNILSTHDQLKNGISNVKSLVSMTDGIQLIAEEIDLV